jgi:UDP-N-acetylglucosamine 2-epimerase
MIYLILGTKAQYLKMVPVIKELEKGGAAWTLVDTGQHAGITPKIRETFDIGPPDLVLREGERDISRARAAFSWHLRTTAAGYAACRKLIGHGDMCLVHGDTLSTLQGAVIAKLCRAKLVHVEAGERTHNIRRPFPEEIIRRLVDRFSDICYASSDNASVNLRREGVRGEIVNVGHNTIFDTVRLASRLETKLEVPEDYILVSIHRAETVFSKRRMNVLTEVVLDMAVHTPVLWGLHEVTRNRLGKYGLLGRLEKARNVSLRGLFDYVPFIEAMRRARFLVTDGGGPQEESFLLNVPCLLMRTETERDYYPNIFLSKFERSRIGDFLVNWDRYRMKETFRFESPSSKIAAHLLDSIGESAGRT